MEGEREQELGGDSHRPTTSSSSSPQAADDDDDDVADETTALLRSLLAPLPPSARHALLIEALEVCGPGVLAGLEREREAILRAALLMEPALLGSIQAMLDPEQLAAGWEGVAGAAAGEEDEDEDDEDEDKDDDDDDDEEDDAEDAEDAEWPTITYGANSMGAAGAAGSAAAAAAAASASADYDDEGDDGDGDGDGEDAGTTYLRDSAAFAAVWAGMEAEGAPDAAAAADSVEEAGAPPGHGLKRRRGGEEGDEEG
jgi:hypothetical protein